MEKARWERKKKCRDGHSLTQAHYTVLQSSTLVAPYIEEHMNIVRSQHPGQSDTWITHEPSQSSSYDR